MEEGVIKGNEWSMVLDAAVSWVLNYLLDLVVNGDWNDNHHNGVSGVG